MDEKLESPASRIIVQCEKNNINYLQSKLNRKKWIYTISDL